MCGDSQYVTVMISGFPETEGADLLAVASAATAAGTTSTVYAWAYWQSTLTAFLGTAGGAEITGVTAMLHVFCTTTVTCSGIELVAATDAAESETVSTTISPAANQNRRCRNRFAAAIRGLITRTSTARRRPPPLDQILPMFYRNANPEITA